MFKPFQTEVQSHTLSLTWQENTSHNRKTSHMTGRNLTWQENISHDRKKSHMTEKISLDRKISHMTGRHLTQQEYGKTSHMTGRHLTLSVRHDRKTSHMTGKYLTWQEDISHDRRIYISLMTGKHLTQQEDISHIKKSKNKSISLGFLQSFEISLHDLNLCLCVIEVTPSWANHHKHRDLHPRLDHCQQTWAGRKKRHMTCALKCCKPGQVGHTWHVHWSVANLAR